MASTNKTTNYELSQYIGTDKPTYLTDYNQDMSKIDAGIHAAKSEADTNTSSIGTLSSLTTEAKTSLVGAINEVDAHADTNAGNIATNTSNIATNTTHIGTLANLTTTSKTDLVVASNEINAKVGNIANLDTSVKTSTVSAINELVSELQKFNLTTFKEYTHNSSSSDLTISGGTISATVVNIARNTDGSIFKFYGNILFTKNNTQGNATITIKNTGISPTSSFSITNAGIMICRTIGSEQQTLNGQSFSVEPTIANNGDISFTLSGIPANSVWRIWFFPCLYFAKNFGDTPTPE